MKRIIGIAACIVMMTAATQMSAQKKDTAVDSKQGTQQKDDRQRPSPEEMAKERADRMKEQLSLTDDQYTKVLALNQEQMQKMRSMAPASREGTNTLTDEQKAARREEMKKSRDEYNAKLKEILTAEQYSKYEENMKEFRNHQRLQGGQGGQKPAEGSK